MSIHTDEFIHSLYQDYGVYIYKFCLSRLKDKGLAMDCMQETFYVALDKLLKSKEKIRNPKIWLTAIANYTIKSFLKKQAIYAKHIVSEDEIATDISNDNYEEELVIEKIIKENIDTSKIIREIKNYLSEKEYELYNARFIEKLSPKDIAKKENISYSAATTRINRVKLKITNIVKRYLNGL